MSAIDQLIDDGLIDPNRRRCTYCREDRPDCRPTCVKGREYIPSLCDDCWMAINDADRIDTSRSVEVWHEQ